jgi:hypothetical protein
MATTFSYSKTIALTDTTDGHKFVPSDFIPASRVNADSAYVIECLIIKAISTGTITMKINDDDDWVPLAAENSLGGENLKMTQFWLKPSASNTVSLIIGFRGFNKYY